MKTGDFIRVRADHSNDSRRGKDGMVVEVWKGSVALLFGHDRHNWPQHCECVGPEMWFNNELDMDTLSI